MTRVLVISNNLRQASYRVRIAPLIERLRPRGIELDVAVRSKRRGERRALLRTAADYDAVLLQRKLLDPSDARLLRRQAKRIFFDVDDAIMFTNRRVRWFGRWRKARRFRATSAILDHVVAGNEYLADRFREHGITASVLPTTVEPGRYLVKEHRETKTPRLVWIGGRSTLPYLEAIVPQLAKAAKRAPGLTLVTIADATIENAPFPVEHVAWSAATEAADLCRGDIGIAPTPTDPWTLGKCGFKLIQYMAAGLPTIASPVGANAEIVVEGETGFLPATEDAWPEVIEKLAGDVELRQHLGSAGRQRVEQRYSIEHVADFWAELLT